VAPYRERERERERERADGEEAVGELASGPRAAAGLGPVRCRPWLDSRKQGERLRKMGREGRR
jgi:hypothetical protein